MALRELLLPGEAQPHDISSWGGDFAPDVQMLLVPVGGALVDLRNPTRLWTPSGSFGQAVTSRGLAISTNGANGYWSHTGYPEIVGSVGTFFVWAPRIGAPDSSGSVWFGSNTGGSLFFQTGTGTDTFFGWGVRLTGMTVDTHNSTDSSLVWASAGTSGTTAFYKNGEKKNTGSGVPLAFPAGDKALRFGAWVGGTSWDTDADVVIAGYSSRAWLPAEIAEFHDDPWRLITRRIWVPVSAAGGSYTLAAESGSYTLAGQAAGLQAARTLAADAGSYTLTGQDVAMQRGQRLVADAGSYTLTGVAAVLSTARVLAADAGSYVLSGQAAGLTKTTAGAFTLAADAGSYTLNGQPVNLAAARRLVADAGAYALTGQAVGLAKTTGYTLTADAGAYSLSGQAAGFARTWRLQAEPGSYSLAGQVVVLVWSGAEVPQLTASPIGHRLSTAGRAARLSTTARPPRTSSTTR